MRSLYARLGHDAARAVLISVDPAARAVRLVTVPEHGSFSTTARTIIVMSMTSSFAAGHLADGVCDGVHMLAEHARRLQR